MALARGASHIITGSFPNLTSVCDYLVHQQQPVILACAAWKDRVNIEDSLFAGAVVNRVEHAFSINCDSSRLAQSMYQLARPDLYDFLKSRDASHYHRLSNYGLEQDLRYCLTEDVADVLPFYENERLVVHNYAAKS